MQLYIYNTIIYTQLHIMVSYADITYIIVYISVGYNQCSKHTRELVGKDK